MYSDSDHQPFKKCWGLGGIGLLTMLLSFFLFPNPIRMQLVGAGSLLMAAGVFWLIATGLARHMIPSSPFMMHRLHEHPFFYVLWLILYSLGGVIALVAGGATAIGPMA